MSVSQLAKSHRVPHLRGFRATLKIDLLHFLSRRQCEPFTMLWLSISLGGPMANLDNAIQQLHQERKLAQLQVEKLDSAIVVLEDLTGRKFGTVLRDGAQPKRVVSVAARRRMARAQRARWASARKGPHSARPGKAASKVRPRRTLTIAARRKIAAAQRARW